MVKIQEESYGQSGKVDPILKITISIWKISVELRGFHLTIVKILNFISKYILICFKKK